MKIKNIIGHFKKICVHRHYVLKYCIMCGIPFQGIVHDLSKFSPTEFFESVKYYCGSDSPINKAKKEQGYSLAWFHHRGRNKHHYEYWIDNLDNGGTPVRIPYKYLIEMICDWIGAGKAYNHNNSYIAELKYVKNKLKTAKINEKDKIFILRVFNDLALNENKYDLRLDVERYLNKTYLKMLYLKYNSESTNYDSELDITNAILDQYDI